MTWFVYMVRCADSSLYTGVAKDVTRRVQEHNTDNKKGARYTRARRPVELVFEELCDNRSHACQREAAIKKLNREQKLRLINSN
jgi:putative endonuclease